MESQKDTLDSGSFSVSPSFAPTVNIIWDDCGTYVTSLEGSGAESELEYFVTILVISIAVSLQNRGYDGVFSALTELGYIGE